MKRRSLITSVLAGAAFSIGNAILWHQAEKAAVKLPGDSALAGIDPSEDSENILDDIPEQHETVADSQTDLPPVKTHERQSHLDKVRFFEREFDDDIYLSESDRPILHAVLTRLEQVQRIVGHGNYNLISFDHLLKYAKKYASAGEFTPAELAFMEDLFFTEAKKYGFLGPKISEQLTAAINVNTTFKVPYSGHFLFKGSSLSYYEKLKRDVGSNIILTSGIRSNVKQMHLFLGKCAQSKYNLSKASRSLAPPGHSFHGIGDFDVGKIGWGYKNFTAKFSQTDEFKRMQELGYVKIRYTKDNLFGVRFEPWHIKVV